MTPEHPTVVGTKEIASRLGVARDTVNTWRQRNTGFPAPSWTIGGRPAWDWEQVKQWAEGRGQ